MPKELTPDQIWQQACAIVGAWEPPYITDVGWHPKRGQPAAAMKMLEWLIEHDKAHMMQTSPHGNVYCLLLGGHVRVADALAAAVVAAKEQS